MAARRSSTPLRCWSLLLGVALPALIASAQTMVPDDRPAVAQTALARAEALVAATPAAPAELVYELGLLQVANGNTAQGLQTILQRHPGGAPAPGSVAGPTRWQALEWAARIATARGEEAAVRDAAEAHRGADRAALLAGIAEASFEVGNIATAIMITRSYATDAPLEATDQLDRFGRRLVAAGAIEPPLELLSARLEVGRAVPSELRRNGRSVQAEVLGRLAVYYVTRGQDDAARAAAESIFNRTDRQPVLFDIALAQAAAGRFEQAVDTANLLSTENAHPISGASMRVEALRRIAEAQAAAGDPGAAATAAGAATVARQTVDPALRPLSLLAASQALAAAGETAAAQRETREALAVVLAQNPPNPRRARVLLTVARAQARAGQRDLAATTFTQAREVVGLARDGGTYDAAVAIPAEAGLVEEAQAGLAQAEKATGVNWERRRLLVRSLAQAGLADTAAELALGWTADTPDTRRERALTLIALVEADTAGRADAAQLLSEALESLPPGTEREPLQAIADRAADHGLPELALAAYAAAVTRTQAAGQDETRLDLDRLLASVVDALDTALAAGEDPSALAGAVEASLGATSDPVARSAVLAVSAAPFLYHNAEPQAQALLQQAAAAIDTVDDPARQVRARCEYGALTSELGLPALSQPALDRAEADLDSLPRIDATTLLTLTECQAQAGQRPTGGRYLVRSLVTAPTLDLAGAADLMRLARVASFAGRGQDALAIADRTAAEPMKLRAYLDLAAALMGQPVVPLRPRDFYPLPEVVGVPEG